MSSDTTITDVLVITALAEELEALKEIAGHVSPDDQWEASEDSSGYVYFHRSVARDDGSSFRIAAANCVAMGERTAANAATRLVSDLRPACLAMCGVCAGDPNSVFLGDVIVADRAFPADDGKLVASSINSAGETHLYDTTTFNLDDRWKHGALSLARDWNPQFSGDRPLSHDCQERILLLSLFTDLSKTPLRAELEQIDSQFLEDETIVKRLRVSRLVKKRSQTQPDGSIGSSRMGCWPLLKSTSEPNQIFRR